MVDLPESPGVPPASCPNPLGPVLGPVSDLSSPLGLYIDELDTLLSSLPDTPLILLGDFKDFKVHFEKKLSSIRDSFTPPYTTSSTGKASSHHLSAFSTLSDTEFLQSRFRHGHSTETALLAVTEALHTTRASDLSSVLILLDLSAACDTVNHQLLIAKLSEIGISGTALSWFRSYLTGRSSRVSEKITACLADISRWMASNHLKLNLDKTDLLFIPARTSPLQELSITVDGTTVTSSTSVKSLGVTLDNRLDFTDYISQTTRSSRFLLFNIRRIRPFLTTYSTQLLVQATVLSCLDYCNTLLAGLPACTIQLLQLIQHTAARLIYNLPKFSRVTPLLRSLHWLPITARIRFKTLTLTFSAAKKTYLQDLIQTYAPARQLRSATSGGLAPPTIRTKGPRSSRHFSVIAPQWWNELPP
ncbi:uncharacterized protein LOC118796418 [Megalops cyprinoides]|uniref:uncharacterized protein LOC118796418 n=1 Tax=Megalops cyprinoides TaxID=118141 RepID=UPI001863DDA1|nr:uncharacterized protein LOC118796418 [Megalops cyprinoides]